MKLIITVLLLLLTSVNGYSQKIVTTYYDSSWLLTSRSQAKFYRVGIIDTVKYQYYGEVSDYYIDGTLEMRGKYKSNIKYDTFYFYFPNGKLKSKGIYKKNKRYDLWFHYYENGLLRDKVLFNDVFIAALEYYSPTGDRKMFNGTGDWEAEYVDDEVKKIINVVGYYQDTLRHGTWKYYSRDIGNPNKPVRLSYQEKYKNGRFLSGEFYSGRGNITKWTSPFMPVMPELWKFHKIESWNTSKHASIKVYPFLKFLPREDSTFFAKLNAEILERSAEYPGGLKEFYKHLSKNITCTSRNSGVQGQVIVTFTINIEGIIDTEAIKFSKPISNSCKLDLIRIFKKSLPWKPALARKNNILLPIEQVLKLPITFK